MADLVVNLSLLERTAGSLSLLIEEFDNSSKIVDSAGIGEPILMHALDDFAGDWTAHRKTLVSKMQAVYKMATESHKAYITTDDQLARDLRKQDKGTAK